MAFDKLGPGLPWGLMLAMGAIGFLPAQRRGAPPQTVPTYGYQVVRSYPHDHGAFTQGLIFRNGFFYEGTGMNGQSGIRKVKVETGEVVQNKALGPDYFGEGITDWKGSLLEITWKSEIGFVYDIESFEQTKTFSYAGEGWGLTHDDSHIIMSDGSAQLRLLDPSTLKETGRITVHDEAGPLDRLNELEYVKGEIYANVWQTERIARISPTDGRVTGWIDLAGLLPAAERAGTDVLNGIAYDAARDRLFVTGKWWPRVFEITLVPRAASRGGV
jgi:glutamine cyclotransferase